MPTESCREGVRKGAPRSLCPDPTEQPIEPEYAIVSGEKSHDNGDKDDCHRRSLSPVQFLDLLLNIHRDGGFLRTAEQGRCDVEAHSKDEDEEAPGVDAR